MKHTSKKSMKISIFSLVLSVIFILGINNVNLSVTNANLIYRTNYDLNYTPHGPIYIDEDDDFGAGEYNFPGSGLINDPYLIANLSITSGTSYSIEIFATTSYFIIENCYLDGSTFGINLDTVASGTALVRNNTLSNHVFGIYVLPTSQCIIRNNTITNCDNGIIVEYTGFSVIEENSVSGCSVGINSFMDNDLTINNNRLMDNFVAMYLIYLQNTNISNNVLLNNGLYLGFESPDDYYELTLFNNTVNNYPIILIFNEEDVIYDASLYGQIILLNCTKVTIEPPLPFDTILYGIHLFFCTDCSVMNTASMNNMYAILAEFSPATKIKDCICSTNFYDTADLVKDGVGIQLTKSNNSLVENSYCSNFDSGIYVYRSHFTEIRNNYLELNWYGIATWTNDLTIKENTIQENFEGITIFAGAGLPATNIIIKNNIIKQSVYYGVSLYSYSHDNIVHHNNFEDNYPTGTSQAKDDGTNNVWYDDSVDEGNFWSDWSGSGSYAIDGTAGSVDLYPFSSSSIPEFSSWGLFILLSLIPVLIIPIVRRTKS